MKMIDVQGHEMLAEVNRQELARRLVVQPCVYVCQTVIVNGLLQAARDYDGEDHVFDEEDFFASCPERYSFYDHKGDSQYLTPDQRDAYVEEVREMAGRLEDEVAELEELVDPSESNPQLKEKQEEVLRLDRHADEIESLDPEYVEVYEWWLVDSYLAQELEAADQIVLTDGFQSYWWGRTCSGQAIVLDGVIQRIAIKWAKERGELEDDDDD